MASDGAALDWLVDSFAPSALRWSALAAGQIDELRGALRLIHAQAVFGAEAAAEQLPAWTQRLQQLCRSAIPDVRWAACCLVGATARTASVDSFQAHGAAWLALLLPLTKPSEPHAVQSIAASAATDILALCQGSAQQAKIDAPAALTRLMPALASLRGVAQHQAEALKATFAMLRAGGNPLRPYAAEIEQSCSGLLDSGNDEVRQSAALCLGSIPTITASPKDDFADWLTLLRKLTDQLRALLDQWLPAAAAPAAGSQRGATKPRMSGPVEDGMVALRRVNGLCIAIGGMLHLPFVGLVQVPLGELIQLISRVLRVSQPASHGEEGKAAVLPKLHAEVLQLLGAVAKAVGRRLLPFAASLGEMLRVAICRPRTTLVGRSPDVQQAALDTADICLGLLRSALAPTLARQVFKEIIASIDSGMGTEAADEAAQFDENAAASGSSRGRGSARKRRGRRSSSGAMDGAGGSAPESLASNRCSETALWLASSKLLHRIVECCGTELSDEERLEVDRAVVGWIVKHGLGGPDGLGYVPAMAMPTLRLELYSTLVASLACPVGTAVKDKEKASQGGGRGSAASGGSAESRSGSGSSGRILPHLHPISRQLFLAGSCNDAAPAVRSVCAEGLRLCTNLAQPRARPLYFPPPGSQMAEPVVQPASILPPPPSQTAEMEMLSSFGGGMLIGNRNDQTEAEAASLASGMGASTGAILPVVTHEPAAAAASAAPTGSVLQSEERSAEMSAAAASVPAAAAATTVMTEQPAVGSTNNDGGRPQKRARAEPAAVSKAAAAAKVAQPAAAGSAVAEDPTFEIVDAPPDSGEDDSDSDSD